MNLRDMTKDEILKNLGIETRPSFGQFVLPVLGIASAALLIGAGIGMMLAPKSGRELRSDLNERMSTMRSRMRREVEQPGQGPVTSTTPY